MKASSFVALSLALSLAPVASAVDSYTVDISRVGANNPVAPGGTAQISIVGHLSQTTPGSNLGLAFFAFDLEWAPAAGSNLNLCTGLVLTNTAAVASFKKNLGYSVDFTGTCVAPDLVQLGGGQNTINNTGMAPFPPFPSGAVVLSVGHGAGGVEMYTGTLTVPVGTTPGVYTLRVKANSLFANAITSQNGGNYVVDPVTAVIGASLPITVGNCTAASIVHGNSLPGQTIPCSGYIDPRRESNDGTNLNQGLTSAKIKFNTGVVKMNGADITGADFTVTETGGGAAPTVSSAVYVTPGDKTYVQVNLSRPITLQQWTTIVANVFDETCHQPIASSGNHGPGMNETDRIDIGFLPADVNQSSNVSPLDLIAFKQVVNASVLPPAGCSQLNTDYTDINRSGTQSPLDLIAFKTLINNLSPSTRSWQGKAMLNPRP